MLDIFSGLRLVVKRRSISIDNAIFRCHWFFTSTLLVSFSLVITARQYVGQPIECHSNSKIPDSLLNSYCWVQSTFIVPQACNQRANFEVPYPCIDNTRGREIKVLAYYQWVGMVLFIQGLLFHLPHYLWKVWENGLIKAITGGLRVALLSDQERNKKKEIVVDYIHNHLGCHKRYALKYFLCELICLINLLIQLWATNKFFDGQFLRYGLDVILYSSDLIFNQFGITAAESELSSSKLFKLPQKQTNIINATTTATSDSSTLPVQKQYNLLNNYQNRVDPMTFIFPRITKCTYHDFGSSGDIQKHDALCLLPLNIINEKIYIALWFWFLVLAILTIMIIIYRLFAIVSENVRCTGLISRCQLSSEEDIRIICRHCDVGDWFLFYMVAENLDPLIMREIVESVADKIRAQLDLKREQGMLPPADNNSSCLDSGYKTKQFTNDRYRHSRPFDESLPCSRRSSLVSDTVSLVRKSKKRFFSKRLWSIDLGSGDLRQQLFGRQPPTNPNHANLSQQTHYIAAPVENNEQITSCLINASAPSASQMSLSSQSRVNNIGTQSLLQRRENLARMGSTSSETSTSDSFVMEMQTIPGSNVIPNN